MSAEYLILKNENRYRLLSSRGKDNQKILKKIERKIRSLKNSI